MSDQPTNRSELLAVIRETRADLEGLLAQLSDDDMLQPGFNGDWTGKDVLAHIVDWEQRFLRWYFTGRRGATVERPEPGMTWDDLDRLNAAMIAAQRPRPLSVIRAEFAGSYRRIVEVIEGMSEDEIFTAGYVAWLPDLPLLRPIRANTDIHYAEHIPHIQGWIARRAG